MRIRDGKLDSDSRGRVIGGCLILNVVHVGNYCQCRLTTVAQSFRQGFIDRDFLEMPGIEEGQRKNLV